MCACLDDNSRHKAEEALRQSEERLRSVLDSSLNCVYRINLKTQRYEFVSASAANLTGYTPDEFMAHSPEAGFAMIHPDDQAAFKAALARLEATGQEVVEYRQRTRNGEYRWLSNHIRLIKNSAGEPLFRDGCMSDITDRKQAAEELQKLTRTLKAHTNSSSAILHGQDEPQYLAEVCRIIVEDCGHAMVWIGYAQDDEGRSVCPVASAGFVAGYLDTVNVTWADTERGRGPMGTAFRTGKPSGWINCLTDPRFEPWRAEALKRGYSSTLALPLIANGDTFGVIGIYSSQVDPFSESEVELLVRLADDLAYGIMALRLRDEVDAARASAEHHAAELESFVSNLADGVTRINPDGRIVWMNDIGRRILGLPPEEDFSNWQSRIRCFSLDGKPIPTDQLGVTRALRGERVTDFRYKMVTPYNHTVVVSASASPIIDSEGRIIGATSTFRDQSERVALENDMTNMLDREHRIAQMLQEALIPFQIPIFVAGCHFAARYIPALDEANVGGDFYDVFEVGNDKVAVLIGDVAGKGVSAAMQVSAARYAFRSYAYIEDSPARVVGLVNEALCKDHERKGKILTAFFAIVSPKDHTVTYANAGHEPPMMRRADGLVEEMTTNGMMLGALPGFDYSQVACSFNAGDAMLLFTDGITEARSTKMGMLGKCGVMQLLADEQGPPSVLVDKLLEKAKEYCDGRLLDDVAIVAVAQE